MYSLFVIPMMLVNVALDFRFCFGSLSMMRRVFLVSAACVSVYLCGVPLQFVFFCIENDKSREDNTRPVFIEKENKKLDFPRLSDETSAGGSFFMGEYGH